MTKGVSANLMQAGSKRRRTKKQIEEDKEEEIRKEQETRTGLAELAALRARVQGLEQQANQGKFASSLLSQMVSAGHIQQDSEDSVVLNAANGQHRFGVNAPGEDQEGQ